MNVYRLTVRLPVYLAGIHLKIAVVEFTLNLKVGRVRPQASVRSGCDGGLQVAARETKSETNHYRRT